MDPMLKDPNSSRTHSPTLDAQFAASPPRFFALKKWTLVTIILLNILFIGLILLSREVVVEKVVTMLKPLELNQEAQKQLQLTLERALPLFALFGLLLMAFFLYGIVRQVLSIATVYAGLILIGALGTALEAILFSPLFWVNTAFSAAVGLVALLYVRDLQFIERYNVGRGRKRLHEEV